MFKTKYEVSLILNTDCLKSPPQSLLPKIPLRYLIVRRVRLSVGAVDLGILGMGSLGPFCEWGTLVGPCGCRRECVPAASYRYACEAFVSRYRHQVSEVFTSGDVSLSNIVIFHCCKSFETRQILLWMKYGDTRFLYWNLKCLYVTLKMVVSYRISALNIS